MKKKETNKNYNQQKTSYKSHQIAPPENQQINLTKFLTKFSINFNSKLNFSFLFFSFLLLFFLFHCKPTISEKKSQEPSKESPTDITLSKSFITEKSPVGSLIGTLTTKDEDSSSHTYSLEAGKDDNDSFSIDGNQLKNAKVFDFTTKKSYSITIKTTDDDDLSFEKNFTIAVMTLPPTDISLSVSSIDEGKPTGTVIGSLSTTDPTTGDTFTYSLVTGSGDDNNGEFSIDGDKLKAAKMFDYEVKDSYSLRIKTTDSSGASFEKAFAISINDQDIEPKLNSVFVNDLELNNIRMSYNINTKRASIDEDIVTYLGSFIISPNENDINYTIKSALLNGGNTDVKNRFEIINKKLDSKHEYQTGEFGYYRITVTAADAFGSVDIPVNVYVYSLISGDIDASALTTGILLMKVPIVSLNYKTGSGNDFLIITGGGNNNILNGGSGVDTYRIDNISGNVLVASGHSIYNFGADDKIEVRVDGYAFSTYANDSSVVATGANRLIYITGTGKLYQDENGDATYDAGNSVIDLNTGSDDKALVTIYSDEGTTFYTGLTAAEISYNYFFSTALNKNSSATLETTTGSFVNSISVPTSYDNIINSINNNDTISTTHYTVTGIPTGLTVRIVKKTSSTTEIHLDGTATDTSAREVEPSITFKPSLFQTASAVSQMRDGGVFKFKLIFE